MGDNDSNTKAFSGSFSADLDFHLGANGNPNLLKTNVEIGYDKYKINQHKQVVSLLVRKREEDKDPNNEELTPFLALVTATDISEREKPTQNFYARVEYPEKIQAGDQVTVSNIQLSITYADQAFVNKMKDIDKKIPKPVLTQAADTPAHSDANIPPTQAADTPAHSEANIPPIQAADTPAHSEANIPPTQAADTPAQPEAKEKTP